MTPTREDVERLVSEVTAAFPNNDYGGSDEALRMGAVPVDASACMETAAMLRALLARAEQAEAARDDAIREMVAMARQAGAWQGIADGKDVVIRQIEAERDAARAEAARLREAHTELDTWARAEIARLRRLWTYMQEAAADIDADEPMTAAEWLAEFSTAEQATRAALATEARDE